MQLRGHTEHAIDQPLEITDEEVLLEEIDFITSILAKEFASKGIESIRIGIDNYIEVAQMLPPEAAFVLGRLVTLQQFHEECFGDDRVIPWIKKPENN
jgi:hypothetical protein